VTSNPIYRAPEPHLEAHSRLISLLSVCEHELSSLEALGDARLVAIIEDMHEFRERLLLTLAVVAPVSEAPA